MHSTLECVPKIEDLNTGSQADIIMDVIDIITT